MGCNTSKDIRIIPRKKLRQKHLFTTAEGSNIDGDALETPRFFKVLVEVPVPIAPVQANINTSNWIHDATTPIEGGNQAIKEAQ